MHLELNERGEIIINEIGQSIKLLLKNSEIHEVYYIYIYILNK